MVLAVQNSSSSSSELSGGAGAQFKNFKSIVEKTDEELLGFLDDKYKKSNAVVG